MQTYKATNTLNGRFYIGSTRDFERRKAQHLKSDANLPFQNALRKNPGAFEWEVWDDESDEPVLEQALLEMWFGKELCYNLNPFADRPNPSLEDRAKAGRASKELGVGIHGASFEELSEWGKRGGSNSNSGILSYKNKTGIFGISEEEKQAAVKKGGTVAYEKGVGLFAPENRGKGAKTTNSTFWEDPDHPELGQLQAGPLVCRQKARGYPHGPENRVRV